VPQSFPLSLHDALPIYHGERGAVRHELLQPPAQRRERQLRHEPSRAGFGKRCDERIYVTCAAESAKIASALGSLWPSAMRPRMLRTLRVTSSTRSVARPPSTTLPR